MRSTYLSAVLIGLPRGASVTRVLSAVSALALASLTGCSDPPDHGAPPPPERPALDAAAVARGEADYARYCALCHGAQAEGYAADHANALGNDDFLRIASDAFLRTAIEDGHPGTPMSGWHRRHGGPLSDANISDLVTYLRSLGDGTSTDVASTRVVGDRAHGATLFAANCAVCHGPAGEGATAVSLNSPTFQHSATDGFVRETIALGREGTPMRGFGAELASQDIDDLTAFVRALPARAAAAPPPMGPPPPALSEIVLNPTADSPSFNARENRFVSGDAVRAALEAHQRIILIDARAPSAWAEGHIPGAIPFPFYEAPALIEHIPDEDTWVIAYCACPHAASGHVVDAVQQAGHARAAILDEGISWWTAQGYPVERGSVPEGTTGGPPAH